MRNPVILVPATGRVEEVVPGSSSGGLARGATAGAVAAGDALPTGFVTFLLTDVVGSTGYGRRRRVRWRRPWLATMR